jgi:hypothetical protein
MEEFWQTTPGPPSRKKYCLVPVSRPTLSHDTRPYFFKTILVAKIRKSFPDSSIHQNSRVFCYTEQDRRLFLHKIL